MSLSISHPLLRNAGNRANTYAIRIAEYERQITYARTKLEVIRVIADVDRVYWRLYAARNALRPSSWPRTMSAIGNATSSGHLI